MPAPRRASMREGPLADLFRKAEDLDGPREDVHRQAEPELPHPALRASALASEQPELRIPSPQERLRHAFSSEIPEDLMQAAPVEQLAGMRERRLDHRLGDAQVPPPGPVVPLHDRAVERRHPPQVRGRDQVHGRPHQPRPDHAPLVLDRVDHRGLVDGGRPGPDAEPGRADVLRLQADGGRRHPGRVGGGTGGEGLPGHALDQEIHAGSPSGSGRRRRGRA